jgi:hypothetical protein
VILDVFLGRLDEVREIRIRYADREEDFEKFRNLNSLEIEEEEKEKGQ